MHRWGPADAHPAGPFSILADFVARPRHRSEMLGHSEPVEESLSTVCLRATQAPRRARGDDVVSFVTQAGHLSPSAICLDATQVFRRARDDDLVSYVTQAGHLTPSAICLDATRVLRRARGDGVVACVSQRLPPVSHRRLSRTHASKSAGSQRERGIIFLHQRISILLDGPVVDTIIITENQ